MPSSFKSLLTTSNHVTFGLPLRLWRVWCTLEVNVSATESLPPDVHALFIVFMQVRGNEKWVEGQRVEAPKASIGIDMGYLSPHSTIGGLGKRLWYRVLGTPYISLPSHHHVFTVWTTSIYSFVILINVSSSLYPICLSLLENCCDHVC